MITRVKINRFGQLKFCGFKNKSMLMEYLQKPYSAIPED
jgi:hypothetical protein